MPHNIAFLFSGQGSQHPGMGKELCENFAAARLVYEQAADCFGFDVLKLSAEGSEEELSQTLVSQPLIYTLSVATFAAASELFDAPFCVAGHSLGEYAAITAAGVVSREDGFRLIRHRAAAMQHAAEQSDGAMAAVLGLEAPVIEEVCAQVKGYVIPVNYNSPLQTAIAGETAAVEEACAALKEKGARRTVRLAVNCGFHSALMQPAAEEFLHNVRDIAFHKPQLPFYSNLDGRRLETVDAQYLARHLVSPVQFVRELNATASDGADAYLELGPGKVLAGLVKKILPGMPVFSAETPDTLKAARTGLLEG